MLSKYAWLIFLGVSQWGFIANAQDTTNFFPHNSGDTWEYYYDGFVFDTLQTKIVFDSLDAEENHYICVSRFFLNPIDYITPDYFKIDTAGYVYQTTNIFSYPRLIYKPNAQKGNIWFVKEDDSEIAKLKYVYEDSLFGLNVTLKEI